MSATDSVLNAQNESPSEADIVIVGGGMVGLCLALMLGKACRHWQIRLIETFPFPASGTNALYQPSFDARSSAIAAGSKDMFERLGVWHKLKLHATEVATVHVSDKGHIGGSTMTAEEYDEPALGYVIDNKWLGQCLFDAVSQLESVQIQAPASVSNIKAVSNGYRLSVTDSNDGREHSLKTRLLVLADGANSQLKKTLGIDLDVKDYQQTAIIANVSFSQPHCGVAFERFTANGPMAILPRGESGKAREGALIWTMPHQAVDKLLNSSEEAFLSRLQEAFGDRLGRFTRIGEKSHYPLKLYQASEQVRGHLAIMGNAAHALHPVAGQGFNLSVRDCALLTDTLHKNWLQSDSPFANLTCMQQYLRSRQSDQFTTIQFSHWLPKLFSTSALPAAAARGAGLLGLELLPLGKKQLAQQSMGRVGRRANFGALFER